MVHDFTRKGGVVHTEILLPDNAPREYLDRETLWNSVEKTEKSKNAQLARDIEIALPNELSVEENIALAREFVQKTFVDKGMCADVCIHNPKKEQQNIHAHIMLTMRPLNDDGTWGDKQRKEYILDGNSNKIYDKHKRTYKCRTVQTTDWNNREKAEEWRTAWCDFLNGALEQHGIAERVDHRSFERQGKDELPTVHLGVAAAQMERKGIRTEKGDINRAVREYNSKLRYLKKELDKVNRRIEKLSEQPKEENLAAMLMRFYENGEKFAEARGLTIGSLKKTQRLKDVASAIAFVQGNHIETVSDLQKKLSEEKTKYYEMKDKLKSIQNRRRELTGLLNNYEIYKPNKAVFQKYESITDKKKKERFYSEHSNEIEAFKAARNMYSKVLKDGKITPKAWKSELEELDKQLNLYGYELERLEDSINVMSTISYNAEKLDNYENSRQKEQTRTSELE